jgi:hypothetical protein
MKRSAKNGFAIHRATLPSAKESGNLDDSGQVSARTTWLDSRPCNKPAARMKTGFLPKTPHRDPREIRIEVTET